MAGTPEAYVLSHRAGWGTEFQGSRPYNQGKLFQGTQEHALVGPGVCGSPRPPILSSRPRWPCRHVWPPHRSLTPSRPRPLPPAAHGALSPGPQHAGRSGVPYAPAGVPTPAPLHPQSLAGPTALSAAAPPLQTLLPGLRDPFKLQVWFGDPHNPP